MSLIFNNYKGFSLSGVGTNADRVDIRSRLQQIKFSESRSKSASKRKHDHEYKTNGFDALDLAWCYDYQNDDSIDEEDAENREETLKIKLNGERLRHLSYKIEKDSSRIDNNNNQEDLSSHTTIYGQNLEEVHRVNSDIEEEKSDDNNNNTNGDDEISSHKGKNKRDKSKPRKQKLTPDERKDIRKKAREMKKNAREMKKQQKQIQTNIDLIEPVVLTGSKSKIKYLRSLLKQCMEKASEKHVDKLKETSIICHLDDVSLNLGDLRNLLDDEWLSDSNISWAYAFMYHGYILPLLSNSLKHSKFYQYQDNKEIFISPICMLLPTFTFLIANTPDPQDLVTCNVLPKGISDAQIIFCPLNDNDDFGVSEGGSHWSLVVFCKLQSSDDPSKRKYIQKAFVYDSMFEANATETKRLVENMSKILYNPKDPKSKKDWDIIHIRDSPQQTNGSDCGVYVTSVTAFLISQLIALVKSSSKNKDAFVDFSLKDVRFSAIDTRIWMLSTLLNCLQSN